jgi:hypothetical protein
MPQEKQLFEAKEIALYPRCTYARKIQNKHCQVSGNFRSMILSHADARRHMFCG